MAPVAAADAGSKAELEPGVITSAPAAKPGALFFNPRGADFHLSPYPHYVRLREQDPVHRSPWGVWFIGKYEHVRAVLKDRRFSSQDIPGQLRRRNDLLKARQMAANQPDNLDALIENAEHWFAFMEGAQHLRLRKLISAAFQKRPLEQMRPQIRACAEQLLDQLGQRAQFDLMADYAKPLPQTVIARLLGVPEQDTARCAAWAHVIARIFDPLLSLDEYAQMNRASAEFMAYLRELVAARRLAPQDDLVSALIGAREDGEGLSEAEIISTLIVTFAAGEETVVATIGAGALALMRHPEQRALLLQRPELMPLAVEEILRYEAPLQMTSRMALEDIELGDKLIRKGEQIYVFLGAANRDPAQFPDPDRFDILRQRAHHMAFSDGIHFCVGAQLARVEIQEAIAALLARFPDLRESETPPAYCVNAVVRSLDELHVTRGA